MAGHLPIKFVLVVYKYDVYSSAIFNQWWIPASLRDIGSYYINMSLTMRNKQSQNTS